MKALGRWTIDLEALAEVEVGAGATCIAVTSSPSLVIRAVLDERSCWMSWGVAMLGCSGGVGVRGGGEGTREGAVGKVKEGTIGVSGRDGAWDEVLVGRLEMGWGSTDDVDWIGVAGWDEEVFRWNSVISSCRRRSSSLLCAMEACLRAALSVVYCSSLILLLSN